MLASIPDRAGGLLNQRNLTGRSSTVKGTVQVPAPGQDQPDYGHVTESRTPISAPTHGTDPKFTPPAVHGVVSPVDKCGLVLEIYLTAAEYLPPMAQTLLQCNPRQATSRQ